MNYARNKKFFKASYSLKVYFVILILSLIVGGVCTGGSLTGSLIIGIGIFAVLLYLLAKKPSYDEILSDAMEEIKDIKEEALNGIGMAKEEVDLIEPIVVHGFDFTGSLSDGVISESIWPEVNHGSKTFYVTPVYTVSVFYFSEDMVHQYTKKFSLVSETKDTSDDNYFYKDIVSISTATTKVKQEDKHATLDKIVSVTYQSVNVTNSGGQALVCSAIDENFSSLKDQINGFRALLRQKKLEK